MAAVLIAALSPIGHAEPLLAVAEGLVNRGDHVTVMTGPAHRRTVCEVGAKHHVLPPSADFDDAPLDAGRRAARSGIDVMSQAIIRLFLRPLPHQMTELCNALADRHYDAMIVDYGFFGVLPLILGDWGGVPPLLSFTPTPLLLSSRDVAPTGMALPPARSTTRRTVYRGLTLFSQKVLLRNAQQVANRMLETLGARPLPVPLLDMGVLADRLIVPTVPSFEYPRSDLPRGVRFVGAVRPRPCDTFNPPPWWHRLDAGRPVVHVTQGTVDNRDLSRLIEPTVAALADSDVVVVVSTGGRDPNSVGIPTPANTHVAGYVPHDRLLPKVDVMVTNGGYGAVQRALASGVPIVVAGSTEDKPEVAARVAWSGAGINLRTGTPSAAELRSAVGRVLSDGRYLRNARRLEAAFARRDGVAEIAALVDEVMFERSAQSRSPLRTTDSLAGRKLES
ncbi:nucleotide disphospho-sugar-binding domain-containing protein [Mycolicibacterium iranicum]|uniref:nucleotide disphospho-sugar-binding domain-containing protein n=1 Tax=Mycolicibacterium iranicum TaxID=912594 RepID=UPI0004678566|nr:glycosyltransferase [Mycolicibacterium iranicum]